MPCVEAFTCAKNPLEPDGNEDQLVIVPDAVYAIVDGATDISGRRWDDALGMNATGGRLASVAIAHALREVTAPLAALPEPGSLVSRLNAALAAVYARLGILDDTRARCEKRFRATLAAAFVAGNRMRLVRLGDSGIRVNGKPQLKHSFAADAVLAAARAEAWRLLIERGVPPDVVRKCVRTLIVKGLDPLRPVADGGLDPAGIRCVVERVAARPLVISAVEGDSAMAGRIMHAGLEGIRKAPQDFNAMVLDGIENAAAAIVDLDLAAVETLEIFSDGYPAMPAEPSIAAWEACLRRADDTDPERIGEFASTKGRVGNSFGDDRSIIIVKREPRSEA